MTTKEKLIQMCVERGMFEDDAKQVVEMAMPEIDKADTSHKTTWNSPSDGYPDVAYAVMFMYVSEKALEWIDKNKPKAWFRGMFELQ